MEKIIELREKETKKTRIHVQTKRIAEREVLCQLQSDLTINFHTEYWKAHVSIKEKSQLECKATSLSSSKWKLCKYKGESLSMELPWNCDLWVITKERNIFIILYVYPLSTNFLCHGKKMHFIEWSPFSSYWFGYYKNQWPNRI